MESITNRGNISVRGNDDIKLKENIHESFGILRMNHEEKWISLIEHLP